MQLPQTRHPAFCGAVAWLLGLDAPKVGTDDGGGQGSVCGGGQAGVGGIPSGVCVDGGDVTQAVVKGPVGEEAAVLGAAGHDVFRRLWWQHCGAWGLGQGLVACGCRGTGSRLENSRAMPCHLFPAPRPHPPAQGPSSRFPLSRVL